MSNQLTTATQEAVAYLVTKIEGIPHPAERVTTSIRTSPVKLNDFTTCHVTHSLAVYSRQCNSPRALTQDPQIRHLHLLRSIISFYVLVDFGS